jgi:hypothetical protein
MVAAHGTYSLNLPIDALVVSNIDPIRGSLSANRKAYDRLLESLNVTTVPACATASIVTCATTDFPIYKYLRGAACACVSFSQP